MLVEESRNPRVDRQQSSFGRHAAVGESTDAWGGSHTYTRRRTSSVQDHLTGQIHDVEWGRVFCRDTR